MFSKYIPLYVQGIGWLIPAIIGGILGYIVAKCFAKQNTVCN